MNPLSDQMQTKKTFGTRVKIFLVNIVYIGAAIALAALIQTFVVRPFIVSGSSMDPNIKNKEYLIIYEVSYKTRQPRRGEIIVFKAPPEPSKYYTKRIIGLPNETIKISGTKITIINDAYPSGFVLDEPYIVHDQSNNLTVEIPDGKYFVMGDNRSASYDSRSWGTLESSAIRGRALLRLLPLSRIDYLPGNETYNEKI